MIHLRLTRRQVEQVAAALTDYTETVCTGADLAAVLAMLNEILTD